MAHDTLPAGLPDGALLVRDYAAQEGCSYHKIYHMAAVGKLASKRVGGRIYILPDSAATEAQAPRVRRKLVPPDGYVLPATWADVHGYSRQWVSCLIRDKRIVPVLELDGRLYVQRDATVITSRPARRQRKKVHESYQLRVPQVEEIPGTDTHLPVRQWAAQNRVTTAWVHQLIGQGRIPGVVYFGIRAYIPKTAPILEASRRVGRPIGPRGYSRAKRVEEPRVDRTQEEETA